MYRNRETGNNNSTSTGAQRSTLLPTSQNDDLRWKFRVPERSIATSTTWLRIADTQFVAGDKRAHACQSQSRKGGRTWTDGRKQKEGRARNKSSVSSLFWWSTSQDETLHWARRSDLQLRQIHHSCTRTCITLLIKRPLDLFPKKDK